MDITFPISVLLEELEVVILTLGEISVTHTTKIVVFSLVHGVETLRWATMLVLHTDLAVSTVTVSSTMTQCLQGLHLSELLVFHMVSDSVGFVVVVGLFHTDTVEKVLLLHTVVMVTVDKVELVAADSSKLHTSKEKKWLLIHHTR